MLINPRYLNLWSPAKGEAKKPVLVFIYGGGFETGTTAGMDGSRLANREDAVVVLPGYDCLCL
jgi:carboxylesterase type B